MDVADLYQSPEIQVDIKVIFSNIILSLLTLQLRNCGLIASRCKTFFLFCEVSRLPFDGQWSSLFLEIQQPGHGVDQPPRSNAGNDND